MDFNRDIRPILSDNCYACHGPDEKERKGKLRFDHREDAVRPAESGAIAIVPGDPAKSALLERVLTQDEDDVMPPRKTGKKLTQSQIDLLRRWIQDGAPFSGHWAFQKPEPTSPPPVSRPEWTRNDIDRFVLARLDQEGVKPSSEASRETLIRRVTLDLTGLPPTPAEVDAFLKDSRSNAYERLVDRLLASPHYGEHMARVWLDGVRYADTHGFHIDSTRNIWRYRDWVIDAYNENLPFDQFTIEQLAGDLLPDPSTEQKIASGYVRCNMSTGEGGVIVDEYAAKYAFDRSETTGTVWMGLTLLCARCHTHKYDPITQKEYYGLLGFFNSIDEDIMDGNKPSPNPHLKLASPEQSARLEALKERIRNGQTRMESAVPALDQRQSVWMARTHADLDALWTPLAATPVASTNGARFEMLPDHTIVATGTTSDPLELSALVEKGGFAGLRLEILPGLPSGPGAASRSTNAAFGLSEIEAELLVYDSEAKEEKPKKLKLETASANSSQPDRDVDKAIDGKTESVWSPAPTETTGPHRAVFAFNQLTTLDTNTPLRIRLRFDARHPAPARFRLAYARDPALTAALAPKKANPWRLIGPIPAQRDLPAALATPHEIETALDLSRSYPGVRTEAKWTEKPDFADGRPNQLVDELQWVHGLWYLHRTLETPVAAEVQAGFRAHDLFKVWLNGTLVMERTTPERPGDDRLTATLRLNPGTNTLLVKIVNLQGACTFTFDRLLLPSDPLPAAVATALAATPLPTGRDTAAVRDFFRRRHAPEFNLLFSEVRRWREQEQALDASIPTSLIARELAKPRETFTLMRGEYDKKGERVEIGVPAIFPPLPASAPTNRLGLARWLTDPGHPLTARVTVNRMWQQVFGVGLVKTSDDFGVQGEHPSHPELLDWLASEFIRSGWNVKRFMALLVKSATYRQDSSMTAESLAKDPENRLLSRGPRQRLDAEALRDTALAISGLLVKREGGRSVKPFEPPGLWEAVSYNNSQKYVPDHGEGQFRRSIYTHWKRQSPPPAMLLLDAPTREFCVVRRPRTNTPLQALLLLNDPQFVDASRAFARRIMREGGRSVADRVRFGFRLATARLPAESEIRILNETYARQLAEYRAHPDAARQYLGAHSPKGDVAAAEWAAWTTIASMLLNLDETLSRG